jgi:antitoxin component YwqK of YwqJK toxin-antitoxin module
MGKSTEKNGLFPSLREPMINVKVTFAPMKLRPSLLLSLFLISFASLAQKKQELLDYGFHPVTEGYNARYIAFTEPREGRWFREIYFVQEKSMAFKGAYRDSSLKIAEGRHLWFYPNGQLSKLNNFSNGKKQGGFLNYDKEGHLLDSTYYENGFRKGFSFSWDKEGYLIDSANFDGTGNGVQASWYPGGAIRSAGRYKSDTARSGRWKYYYEDGKTLADIIYDNDKTVSCRCWDEAGQERDSALCREQEAEFPGGSKGWIAYLQKNLQVPRGVGPGRYVVYMQFVVDKEGNLSSFEPLTSLGHGLEQEVERLLRKSPRWIPATQYGRRVKAYRTQPITFMISE